MSLGAGKFNFSIELYFPNTASGDETPGVDFFNQLF